MRRFIYILLITVTVLNGCSDAKENPAELPYGRLVPIYISNATALWKQNTDAEAHSVNRILVLPFRKVDESVTENEGGNFEAVFASARQFDTDAFPTYYSMLNLTAGTTWKVLMIGYNRSDYDFENRQVLADRFVIEPDGAMITLENISLRPVNTADVPGFFSAVCRYYDGNIYVGEYFRAEQGNNLRGELKRIVSGLSLTLDSIPVIIDSIAIGAEQLVQAASAITGHAALPTGTNANKGFVLSTQIPQNGRVVFEQMLLPAAGNYSTRLFLDISFNGGTERHIVHLANRTGLVSSDSITFHPNERIEISGSYSRLDAGFKLNNTIDLDDDDWDGLQ